MNVINKSKNPIVWEQDAVEALSAVERLIVLSAINRGKEFVNQLVEKVSQEKNIVTKADVQQIAKTTIDEFLQARTAKPS